MNNKPIEQIAYDYECDFRERVSAAENDPNVLMVPVDEPSQHFMAGWYAALEHFRCMQALQDLSNTNKTQDQNITVKAKNITLTTSGGTFNNTNVYYDPVIGWVAKLGAK